MKPARRSAASPRLWRGRDAGKDLALGAAGCRIGGGSRTAPVGSGGVAAAAARQQAAPGGERDPAESLGFFRQVGGESMKAKLTKSPADLLKQTGGYHDVDGRLSREVQV